MFYQTDRLWSARRSHHPGALLDRPSIDSGGGRLSVRDFDETTHEKSVSEPMIATPPIVALCPDCNCWFWIDDAEAVDDRALSASPTPIEPWDELTSTAYKEILRSGQYRRLSRSLPAENDSERERALRVRLWWALNTDSRERHSDAPSRQRRYGPTSQEFRDNSRQLATLLAQSSSIDDIVTRAEALRELGAFGKSAMLFTELVEEYTPEPDFDWIVARGLRLRQEALHANLTVVERTPGRPDGPNEPLDESIPRTIHDL